MPLTHVVPVRHEETAAVVTRRRRVVAGTSRARRRAARLVAVDEARLHRFYGLDRALPRPLDGRRPAVRARCTWAGSRAATAPAPAVVTPVATGVGAFGVLLRLRAGGPPDPVPRRARSASVLAFAEEGNGPLVLLTTYANGLGEEVFFRGALYATLPRDRAVAASTGVYALATVTTRNPSLVIAAVVMGGLFGMQRRATGGLQAPADHPPDLVHADGALPATAVPPPPRRPMSHEAHTDVVVVGGGLAGLACARALAARGLEVRCSRRGDAVGGRVRTDHVDGYTLDRGFQVLNTAYPELPAVADLRGARPAGVRLLGGVQHRRASGCTSATRCSSPTAAASALGIPVGGVGGKAAFGLYAGLCATLPARGLKHRDDVSAAEAWRRASIPPDVVNAVLRPFFAGVLLEQEMSTSRRFTDLMMRMFARGRSTVPAGGMQRLPEHIAGRPARRHGPAGLPRAEVAARPGRDRRRHRRRAGRGGRHRRLDRRPAAAGRLPGRRAARRHHRLPRAPVVPGGVRDAAARRRPVPGREHHRDVLRRTGVRPAGPVLVSTSMVHGAVPADVDGPEVRRRSARLHGTDTSRWEQLATYDLPRALPGMPAPHPMRRPVRLTGGGETVYVAGDHRDTSSIQGALVSGRRAATPSSPISESPMTARCSPTPSTPCSTGRSCPATPRSATGCAGAAGRPTTRAPARCAAGSWSSPVRAPGSARPRPRRLARLGATVHLVVRDLAKGRDAVAEIRGEVPGAELVLHRCDVSDLASVRPSRPRCGGRSSGSTCSCTTPGPCRPSGRRPATATRWPTPPTCSDRCC